MKNLIDRLINLEKLAYSYKDREYNLMIRVNNLERVILGDKRVARGNRARSSSSTVQVSPTTSAPSGIIVGYQNDQINDDEWSISAMRRETARLNLDVLRRMSSMLGAQQDKLGEERQMLSANRDMLRAEMRRSVADRARIVAEQAKVNLERDVLQSQLLGLSSARQMRTLDNTSGRVVVSNVVPEIQKQQQQQQHEYLIGNKTSTES